METFARTDKLKPPHRLTMKNEMSNWDTSSTSARFFCLLPVPEHISQGTALIAPPAHGQLVCCPRETIPAGHPTLRFADWLVDTSDFWEGFGALAHG